MIIGFCGPKRSGKNYVANALLERIVRGYISNNAKCLFSSGQWHQTSFAEPLREFVLDVFGMNHSHAEGYLKEVPVRSVMPTHDHVKAACKHYFGNQKPARLISSYLTANQEQYKFINKSYRELMVYIGTELIRNGVDQEYWVKVLSKNCKKDNYIITDVRMENEADFVRENGVLVQVVNPEVCYTQEHSTEVGVLQVEEDLVFYNDVKLTSSVFNNKIKELKDQIEERLL